MIQMDIQEQNKFISCQIKIKLIIKKMKVLIYLQNFKYILFVVLEIMKNHNVTQFYSLHDLFTIIWEIDYVKDGILMKNEKNKVGVNPKLIEFLK